MVRITLCLLPSLSSTRAKLLIIPRIAATDSAVKETKMVGYQESAGKWALELWAKLSAVSSVPAGRLFTPPPPSKSTLLS